MGKHRAGRDALLRVRTGRVALRRVRTGRVALRRDRARYEALLGVPKSVYSSMTEFATDPAPMESHRERLARAIETLLKR